MVTHIVSTKQRCLEETGYLSHKYSGVHFYFEYSVMSEVVALKLNKVVNKRLFFLMNECK